ncbi:PTS sugar transporter subunit IIC [Clostridium sp. LIBA-8841]|uniref:PTS sugar transporter subunit IIC n=1 Tax=Clostridium sp. LIBA-8841 TaxID=2987530 RepID=UPI002AC4E942|nr:PTS transporter subunit EIIC [Clostridium sp. LIBA-8841]MDZ5254108.1 PTS transporter subunit EIIC [Clostridium sp. LIBA-8841]
MENKFLAKLDEKLSPLGAKLGNQIHLRAISAGMMMPLALIVVGALFLIIANPPITMDLVDVNTSNILIKFLINWKNFSTENYALLTAPFNMTMGIFGLLSVFGISYSLAKEYKLNAPIVGLISTSIFLMVAAPAIEGGISTQFLGADGLFVGIIISILSVEITRFIELKGLKMKFPSSVPPAVTSFVNSILPVLANIVIIYGLNIILVSMIGKNIPEAIMSILTPALSVVDNIGGFLFIITFGNILWLFGINGTSIIFPILFSLGITNTGINSELIAAGQDPTALMNLQMFRIAIMGGAGNTLGLVLLMCKSKSIHLKSLGRLSLVPGICGINEPIIFGGPIVFNPILAIPFILTPIVTCGLTYFAQLTGFITPGYIVDPSFTPFFAQAYLSSLDAMNVLFVFLLIPVSMVLYYPFFKIFEKNTMKNEMVATN